MINSHREIVKEMMNLPKRSAGIIDSVFYVTTADGFEEAKRAVNKNSIIFYLEDAEISSEAYNSELTYMVQAVANLDSTDPAIVIETETELLFIFRIIFDYFNYVDGVECIVDSLAKRTEVEDADSYLALAANVSFKIKDRPTAWSQLLDDNN